MQVLVVLLSQENPFHILIAQYYKNWIFQPWKWRVKTGGTTQMSWCPSQTIRFATAKAASTKMKSPSYHLVMTKLQLQNIVSLAQSSYLLLIFITSERVTDMSYDVFTHFWWPPQRWSYTFEWALDLEPQERLPQDPDL